MIMPLLRLHAYLKGRDPLGNCYMRTWIGKSFKLVVLTMIVYIHKRTHTHTHTHTQGTARHTTCALTQTDSKQEQAGQSEMQGQDRRDRTGQGITGLMPGFSEPLLH